MEGKADAGAGGAGGAPDGDRARGPRLPAGAVTRAVRGGALVQRALHTSDSYGLLLGMMLVDYLLVALFGVARTPATGGGDGGRRPVRDGDA